MGIVLDYTIVNSNLTNMRYGHLIAGLLFLIFLFALGVFIVTSPFTSSSKNKIDVSAGKSQGPTKIDVSKNYYSEPQSAKTAEVSYDANGFSPVALTVDAGTVVVFKNVSQGSFWPSGDYAQIGSCGTSAFDSCLPIPPGSSWSMRFDRIGSWGYHDNLNPGNTGRIIVKPAS